MQEHVASSGLQARHEIQLSRLDQRLRLPLCNDDALSASLESPATPVGRVTVRVSCSAPSPGGCLYRRRSACFNRWSSVPARCRVARWWAQRCAPGRTRHRVTGEQLPA
ncbi:hypothetical protein UMZ34_18250 [Halopseudomonas pachastrellae]|nr:hypothetical protein UMZ34_18250 [Halopseudomonas pachastrellae]